MPKRLVICCDGTWITPDQTAEGWPCPTNVTEVALEIAPAGTVLRYRSDWAYRPGTVAAHLARGGRCTEVGSAGVPR